MDIISALLILLSATFASVRNILIKGFSGFTYKKREFFGLQAAIFGMGIIVLSIVNLVSFNGYSLYTFIVAIIYGIMLLCAQWFYTIALSMGKTAICATLYSFGFLIPTLSGAIFWEEKITVFGYLGIIIIIPVLIISGMGKKSSNNVSTKSYIFPIFIALLCSGGLGIVQKIQQNSAYTSQTNAFILTAFIFCFVVSLLFFLFLKKGEAKIKPKNLASCAVVGLFFSSANMLNTYLAGKLDSSVFFPVLNIGGILLSLILGLIVYKEKLTKKDILVVSLSVIAIILINF